MEKETYWLLNRIKIAFNFVDEDMLEKMIKTLIRPRLEYAAVVWSPHLKKAYIKIRKGPESSNEANSRVERIIIRKEARSTKLDIIGGQKREGGYDYAL